MPATMEAAPESAPVGLLCGQDGLRETGTWCDKLATWRRHLQPSDGRYVDIVEDYSASDTGKRCSSSTHRHTEAHTQSNRYLVLREVLLMQCGRSHCADGAWILWSGSLVLARCVESHAIAVASSMGVERPVAAPFVAVELGAGSGLVSVVAAAAGLHAIATEQESGLPYLRANAAANAGLFTRQQIGSCTVQKLHWGTDSDVAAVAATAAKLARASGCTGAECAPALLLGSDLTYLPAVMEPLAETLAKLAGPHTVVWIAHDDASHPGCPRHRATFFGTPQDAARDPGTRRQTASARSPQSKPGQGCAQDTPRPNDGSEPEVLEGNIGWQGTHT